MRRSLTALIAALGAVAVPGAAHANFFAGEPIDGPSPELQALGDVDLARDGTGALAYLKREGGVDHVFVSRFLGGRFQAPERIDAALGGPSSQPVVGASDGGRLVVMFVNSGVLHGVVRPAGQAFSAPVAIAPGADPAVDLSINGTAYSTFTSGGDVRVVRLDRRSNRFELLAAPADVDPAHEAGVGSGRSKVAVSADGVGVVTWGEAGQVYARKMFNSGLSKAPQQLSVPSFEGRPGTGADLPHLDAEDDSSYAWVVFRQAFSDGGSRTLARRQRGTEFDPPVAVDAGDEPVDDPRIDLNGRGVGLASTAGAGSRQPMAAVLEQDAFGKGHRIGRAGLLGPTAVPVMAENNDGLVAFSQGGPSDAFVRARPFDDGNPRPEVTLSRPELGVVDPARGFDAASDRAAGVVVAWVQGGDADRRIVAGYFDRPPLSFSGYTSARCCRDATPRLSWQPAFDLWGPVKYTVLIDGRTVGQTTDTRFEVPIEIQGPTHRWQVVATDVRGQTRRSRSRLLRIDDVAPRQSVSVRRRGRTLTVSVRGRDPKRRGHRQSGVRQVVVSWGDRTRGARGRSRVRAEHRYRRRGTFPLEITTRDKAGNEVRTTRSIRIR